MDQRCRTLLGESTLISAKPERTTEINIMASSVKNTNFADVIINNQQTMKKILMMAFTASLLLALGACGNNNSQGSTTKQGEEMYSVN